MRSLIYSTVFIQDSYLKLLWLLLNTYKRYGNTDNSVTYLVVCSEQFKPAIDNMFKRLQINGMTWVFPVSHVIDAIFSRLHIFEWEHIHEFSRVLYLDTDIIIANDVKKVLEIDPGNKIYVLEEGTTKEKIHGAHYFGKNNPNVTAFTSGIILFNNTNAIRRLFTEIMNDARTKVPLGGINIVDQPYIVYHAVKNDMYDNQVLKPCAFNNPESYQGHSILHFPGPIGAGDDKISVIQRFLSTQEQLLGS